jgi:glycine/D-amino acid oxidase-like deaminating enzyme
MANVNHSAIFRFMSFSARLAAYSWPLAGPLFPEKMAFDQNSSLWVSQTPDYRPGPPLQGQIEADMVVIGGGFTGTSAAYYISQRFPERRVILLEAVSLANGASGRNGGLMLNWINGFDSSNAELDGRIYQITNAGIDEICARIQRHNLPVTYRRDGAVTIYTDAARAEAARVEVEQQNKVGIPTQFLTSQELRRRLNVAEGCGAALDPNGGQINGAQLVRGMRPVLQAQGVQIYEQTPALKIEEGETIRIITPEGEIKTNAIVLATNGYTSKLGYFRDALFPLHSHLFATAALSPEQQAELGWHGLAGFADDLDRISYGAMTADGHLVFGGGSNQSYDYLFNNGVVYPGGAAKAKRAHRKMEETLRRYFPTSDRLPIAHRWVGTLGITFDRRPLIGKRGEHGNVYYALGYCGHGVTLGNLAGQILADLYAGDDGRWRDLPFIQSGYPPVPPEPFRWIGYQLFTRLTGQSPRA